jgi:hypothetical protein
MARKIRVPRDITIVDPITRIPLRTAPEAGRGEGRTLTQSFGEFAIRAWCNDPRVGFSPERMRRLVAHILPALEKARGGEELLLEDQDWALLEPIVNDPQIGQMNPGTGHISPIYNAQLLPFYDAFLSAESVAIPTN